MIFAENTVHSFLQNFLNLYMCKQDKPAVLNYLYSEVVWFGSIYGKMVVGLNEVTVMLDTQYSKYKAAVEINENDFKFEQISDNSVYVYGQYEINFDTVGELNKRLHITALCIDNGKGELLISKIHTTLFGIERKSEKTVHKALFSGKKALVPESIEQQQDLLIAYVELKRQNEELLKKNKKLVELTTMDLITRTYNQDVIISFILAEMDRFSRYGHIFSLLSINIDNFKEVNNLAGNIIGNLILKNVAFVIKKQLRKNDRLGRYVGDKFLLVLPNTELDGAIITAQRIRTTIEKISFKKYDGKITVSIGVCEYTQLNSIEQLVTSTEQQLDIAKKNGKNRICANSEII